MGGKLEVHSLADFQHHPQDMVRRMQETGNPIVLTVEGRADLVILDASVYRSLVDRAEEAIVGEGIRRGLDDMRAGRGQPAERVFDELRDEFHLPRDA